MTNKITLTTTSMVLSTLLLIGCGGSSDPKEDEVSKVTGQFIDTYVKGLNYTCSSGATGVTNSEGEYTCNTGDTVEFSLGGYLLGSAAASSGTVTPVTLYPDNPDAALDVAQLLQTLDSDSDDGIITIPENYTDLDEVATTPGDDNFDTQMEEELGEPLVSEEDAQEHMDGVTLSNYFTGQTRYFANINGGVGYRTYNADGTYSGVVGDTEVGGTYSIDGNTMTLHNTLHDRTLIFTYLGHEYEGEKFALTLDNGSTTTYQYRTSSERSNRVADLENLIVGQTKNFSNSNGYTGYREYNVDGTFTGSVSSDTGTVSTSGTYLIDDTTVTINRTSPNDVTFVLNYLGSEGSSLHFNFIGLDGSIVHTISN